MFLYYLLFSVSDSSRPTVRHMEAMRPLGKNDLNYRPKTAEAPSIWAEPYSRVTPGGGVDASSVSMAWSAGSRLAATTPGPASQPPTAPSSLEFRPFSRTQRRAAQQSGRAGIPSTQRKALSLSSVTLTKSTQRDVRSETEGIADPHIVRLSPIGKVSAPVLHRPIFLS